jgi:hypothetical protein
LSAEGVSNKSQAGLVCGVITIARQTIRVAVCV